jgi:hypothetical protein
MLSAAGDIRNEPERGVAVTYGPTYPHRSRRFSTQGAAKNQQGDVASRRCARHNSRFNRATGHKSAVKRSERGPSTTPRAIPQTNVTGRQCRHSRQIHGRLRYWRLLFSRCRMCESAHIGSRRVAVIVNTDAIRRKNPGVACCRWRNNKAARWVMRPNGRADRIVP